jgi:hypothetical protein
VEGVLERYEFEFRAGGIEDFSRFAGEFYGGFVGFAAGVAYED